MDIPPSLISLLTQASTVGVLSFVVWLFLFGKIVTKDTKDEAVSFLKGERDRALEERDDWRALTNQLSGNFDKALDALAKSRR